MGKGAEDRADKRAMGAEIHLRTVMFVLKRRNFQEERGEGLIARFAIEIS